MTVSVNTNFYLKLAIREAITDRLFDIRMGNCLKCFTKEDDEQSIRTGSSELSDDRDFDSFQDHDLNIPNEADERIKKMCTEILQTLIDNDHTNILGQRECQYESKGFFLSRGHFQPIDQAHFSHLPSVIALEMRPRTNSPPLLSVKILWFVTITFR